MHTVPVPNEISSLNNFDVGPVFASWIKKLRKTFTWWKQLHGRSGEESLSTFRQFWFQIQFLDRTVLIQDLKSLLHRSRNSRRAVLNETFEGQFLQSDSACRLSSNPKQFCTLVTFNVSRASQIKKLRKNNILDGVHYFFVSFSLHISSIKFMIKNYTPKLQRILFPAKGR